MTIDWSQPRRAKTNGIEMSYHDAGEGVAVVFLHGFPELAFSWRNQVDELVAAGYRVIVPTQRGYPGTDVPTNLESYNVKNLVADLTGLLDVLDIRQAVIVGHDWGGLPTWYSPVFAPERILGVASLCTPFIPRMEVDFVKMFEAMKGPDNYIVRIQEPETAEALLGADYDATFRSIMRRRGVSLEEFRSMPAEVTCLPLGIFVGAPQLFGELLVDEQELEVYSSAYEKSGFTGPLNWYRALPYSWKHSEGYEMRVDVPALMISARDDWFLPPDMTDGMELFVPKVEKHVIEGAHWIQQENPIEVNRLLLDWLNRHFS